MSSLLFTGSLQTGGYFVLGPLPWSDNTLDFPTRQTGLQEHNKCIMFLLLNSPELFCCLKIYIQTEDMSQLLKQH